MENLKTMLQLCFYAKDHAFKTYELRQIHVSKVYLNKDIKNKGALAGNFAILPHVGK